MMDTSDHPFPIIRLEVEGMRRSIMMALSPEVVSRQIQGEVDRVVENYDFGAAVSQAVSDVLGGCIDGFFRCGEGHRAIEGLIREALSKALASPGGSEDG